MTAASLEAVSVALGTALASIPDLEPHDLIGGPYNFPCAIVDLPRIDEYEITMGRTGDTTAPFEVIVAVARMSDTVAMAELLAYVDPIGDRSVRSALMADKTLGGVVENVYIRSFERRVLDLDGVSCFGAVFGTEVTFKRETV